jgi:hypothetical protein
MLFQEWSWISLGKAGWYRHSAHSLPYENVIKCFQEQSNLQGRSRHDAGISEGFWSLIIACPSATSRASVKNRPFWHQISCDSI